MFHTHSDVCMPPINYCGSIWRLGMTINTPVVKQNNVVCCYQVNNLFIRVYANSQWWFGLVKININIGLQNHEINMCPYFQLLLFIYLFVYLYIYLFIYLYIYCLFVYLFIYQPMPYEKRWKLYSKKPFHTIVCFYVILPCKTKTMCNTYIIFVTCNPSK